MTTAAEGAGIWRQRYLCQRVEDNAFRLTIASSAMRRHKRNVNMARGSKPESELTKPPPRLCARAEDWPLIIDPPANVRRWQVAEA